MPKITRYGGPTNFGLTESEAGFSEDTASIRNQAAVRASSDPTGEGWDNDGEPVAGRDLTDGDEEPAGLVAGGDETPAGDEPPFNPSELSVSDVNGLLEDCSDAEREKALAAERADKNRKGIVGS